MENDVKDYELLITRYLSGDSTKEERQTLFKWLQQDEGNMRFYMQCKAIWHASKARKIYFDRNKEWSRLYQRIKPSEATSFWHRFTQIAAIVVISFLIGWLVNSNFLQSPDPNWITVEVPNGDMTHFSLSDGSEIWLNSESTLKYPSNFTSVNRNVYLSGEAYFDVSSNDKAFIVKTDYMDVRVTGTRFNVKAYQSDEAFSTVLLEGSVTLKSERTSYRMKPGELARLNTRNDKFEITRLPDSTRDSVSWINGRYKFVNEPLARILKTASRWYDIEFVVKGKALRNTRFTGIIKKSYPPEQLLRLIKKTENIAIKRNKEKIIIEKQ